MQVDKQAVEVIKKHFTSDAIENEYKQWVESGYSETLEAINLKEAYKELTGLSL